MSLRKKENPRSSVASGCPLFSLLESGGGYSLPEHFMILTLLKRRGPDSIESCFLSGVRLWLDSGCAFWRGIPQKWCVMTTPHQVRHGKQVCSNADGVNFDHLDNWCPINLWFSHHKLTIFLIIINNWFMERYFMTTYICYSSSKFCFLVLPEIVNTMMIA